MNKKHLRVILGFASILIMSTFLFFSTAEGQFTAYQLHLPIVQKGEDIQVSYPIETQTPGSPFDPYPVETATPEATPVPTIEPTIEPTPFKIYLPAVKK